MKLQVADHVGHMTHRRQMIIRYHAVMASHTFLPMIPKQRPEESDVGNINLAQPQQLRAASLKCPPLEPLPVIQSFCELFSTLRKRSSRLQNIDPISGTI